MSAVNYVWDVAEASILREYDDGGAVLAEYATGPRAVGLISQHSNGTIHYYHFDGNGSTTELTSATGVTTDSRRYTVFGETALQAGSTLFYFQFLGQNGYYADTDIRTYSYSARYYQPESGRWLSRERIAHAGYPLDVEQVTRVPFRRFFDYVIPVPTCKELFKVVGFACGDCDYLEWLDYKNGLTAPPIGIVTAAIVNQKGCCLGISPVNPITVSVTFSTHTPLGPDHCSAELENRLLKQGFRSTFNMLPSSQVPSCKVTDRGTLHIQDGVVHCSFITWTWTCNVDCKNKVPAASGCPSGQCYTAPIKVTIGSAPPSTFFTENLIVQHNVAYRQDCCDMDPCSASIVLAQKP